MCFKFWRKKTLPPERRQQSTPKPAEGGGDNDAVMAQMRRKIDAINQVREAAKLRRKEDGTEKEDQIELKPPQVSFYLDPEPERYDIDSYLTPSIIQYVDASDSDDDVEDVNNDGKKRCLSS
ncbi:unnamed protein product [Rodentolepis nana]|uniref:Protein GOLM2 n=1 Tax=Rodentolepis nana TaxID=102285 RepID=A0A0R3TDU9_RODNA|nr:unnamed protein product [Rodentolepis nana]